MFCSADDYSNIEISWNFLVGIQTLFRPPLVPATYEELLRWCLDSGGIQRLDSLKTEWNYIRMLHRDMCNYNMDQIIWDHMTKVYFLFRSISLTRLMKCDSSSLLRS